MKYKTPTRSGPAAPGPAAPARKPILPKAPAGGGRPRLKIETASPVPAEGSAAENPGE